MCSYYIYQNIQIIYSHILCYILTPWGSNQIELENLQGISWQQVGSTNLASGPSAAICSRCPCNVLFKAFEGTHNLPTNHTPEPLPLSRASASCHLSDMRPFVREKVASALRFFLSAKHLKMLSSCSCQTRCKAPLPLVPSLSLRNCLCCCPIR